MLSPHPYFSIRRIALLALITAACIVGRLFFVWLPNVQPMSAILFLLVLSGTLPDALIVALLSLLGTNLYLGMGPWTISQFVALTVTIVLFYFVTKIPLIKQNRLLQACLAFVCGIVYGLVVSRMEVWLYQFPSFLAYYLQGITFDLFHSSGNFVFYLILAPVFGRMMPALKRLKEK
jgi:energy-coupling factor transport system substrate-specific component